MRRDGGGRRAKPAARPEGRTLPRFFRSEAGRTTGALLAFFAGLYAVELLRWLLGSAGNLP